MKLKKKSRKLNDTKKKKKKKIRNYIIVRQGNIEKKEAHRKKR